MIVDGQYITYGLQLNQQQVKQLLRPKRRLFRQVVVPPECQLIELTDWRLQVLSVVQTFDTWVRTYSDKIHEIDREIEEHTSQKCEHYTYSRMMSEIAFGSADYYSCYSNVIDAMQCMKKISELKESHELIDTEVERLKQLVYWKQLDSRYTQQLCTEWLREHESKNSDIEHVISEYLLDDRIIELATCLDLELSEEKRVECGNTLLQLALTANQEVVKIQTQLQEQRAFELQVEQQIRTAERQFALQANALVGDMLAQDALDKLA